MNYNQLVNQIIDAKTKEYPNRYFQIKKPILYDSEGGVYIANAYNWGDNSQQVAFKLRKLIKENEKNFISQLIQYQINYEKGGNSNYVPTNIIQIYEYFEWEQHHCTVMEVGQESLFNWINQNKNVSSKERERFCFQITQPILFLHKQKYIHRDIRPENFIKVGNVFKLIDFGLIRGSNPLELKTIQIGTLIYQAPEIIQCSNKYTEKVDIWSLACVFYQILTASPLFDEQVTKQIQNNNINPQYINNKISQLNISETIKNLLIKMLTYEESKRPAMQQIYNEFLGYFNETGQRITELEDKQISEKIKLESKIITEQQNDNQTQKPLGKYFWSSFGSNNNGQNNLKNSNMGQTKPSITFNYKVPNPMESNQTQIKYIEEKFIQFENKFKSQQEEKDKQIESLRQQVQQQSNEKKSLEEQLNTALTQLQKQQHDIESNLGNKIKLIENNISLKNSQETTVINPNLQNYIDDRIQEFLKKYHLDSINQNQFESTKQYQEFDQKSNSQNKIDNYTEQQNQDKQQHSGCCQGLNQNNKDTEQQSLDKQNECCSQGLNQNVQKVTPSQCDQKDIQHGKSQQMNQNNKLFLEQQQQEIEYVMSYFKEKKSMLFQNFSNILQSSQIDTDININNNSINQRSTQPEQYFNQGNKQIEAQENNKLFQINQPQCNLSQQQNLPSEVQIEQINQSNSQLQQNNQQQINEQSCQIQQSFDQNTKSEFINSFEVQFEELFNELSNILQTGENKYLNQIDQLKEEVESLKQQLDNANQEKEQIQTQAEAIYQLNSEQQNIQLSLSVQNNQIIIENRNLKSNFEMLQQTSEAEILELKTENDQLYQRIKELEENNKNLNSDLGQLKQEKTEKVNQLLELVNENQYLQNSLNQTNQPLTQVNALCDYFKNKQNIKEFAENHKNDFQTLLSLINS